MGNTSTLGKGFGQSGPRSELPYSMQRADTVEGTATYERVVYKNASVYHYMRIILQLENEETRLYAAELKQLIITGLRDLYGEVGAAFPFDLLTFDADTLTAVLRVCNSGLVKLWSALTLVGSIRMNVVLSESLRSLLFC